MTNSLFGEDVLEDSKVERETLVISETLKDATPYYLEHLGLPGEKTRLTNG